MNDLIYFCPMCEEPRFGWDYNHSDEICDSCFEKRLIMLKKAYMRIKEGDETVAA